MALVSAFTPWLTPRTQLEALLVGRQALLDDLVDRIRRAATTHSRQHTLVVGPRGAGKTHLLALAYHRAFDLTDQDGRFQLARLPEDPWTIASYRHLLAAILADLDPSASTIPGCLVPLPSVAELESHLTRHFQNGGVIVVLVENLDEVFAQIGLEGQRQLRHFLQTTPYPLLLLATTPTLGRSLSSQSSPFYGFFDTLPLAPLTLNQALELVLRVAQTRDDQGRLAAALHQVVAKRRLEAVAHIAGSQPRLWVTFGQTLTPEGIQRLADALMETFDDLTPSYQDRVRALSPQQRLVVGELASADHPLPVQDIARRVDITEKTAARLVRELARLDWVARVATPWNHLLDRRRSYYELADPLARLAFQLKGARGEPLRLIVDFLSYWFDQDDVSGWRRDQLESHAAGPAVDLLGQVDDALAALHRGDAEPVMALPSSVRTALEQRWAKVDSRADEPAGSERLLTVRRELHQAALAELGQTPDEPRSGAWIARAERLAADSGSAPADLSRWSRWLSQGRRFDEAEAVADLIDDAVTARLSID